MADLKISQLPTITPLTGAELMEFVQGGANKQGTATELKDFMALHFAPSSGSGNYWKTSGTTSVEDPVIWADDVAGIYFLATNTALTQETIFNITPDLLIGTVENFDADTGTVSIASTIAYLSYVSGGGAVQSSVTVYASGADLYYQGTNEVILGVNDSIHGNGAAVSGDSFAFSYAPTNFNHLISDNVAQNAEVNMTKVLWNVTLANIPATSINTLEVTDTSVSASVEIVAFSLSELMIDSNGSVLNVQDPGDVIIWKAGATFTDGAHLWYGEADLTGYVRFRVGVGDINILAGSNYPGFAGIQYEADYSADFNPLSLINLSFADGRYAPIASTAFWKTSGASVLAVGTTTIDIDGNTLLFDTQGGTFKVFDSTATFGYLELDLSGDTFMGVQIYAGDTGNFLDIRYGINASFSAVHYFDNSFVFDDARATPLGVEYATDIAATLIDTSLANVSYSKQVATRTFTMVVGDSVAVTTGGKAKTRYVSPIKGTIIGWKIVLDQPATVTLDVWAKAVSTPTGVDTITAAAKPSTSATDYAASSTLTGWTTAVEIGDVFQLEVEANDSANSITLELVIRPTLQ